MATYGTLTTLDTLGVARNALVGAIGEDKVFEAVQLAFDVHNELKNEKLAELVERTTDRLRIYGGVDSMTMDELDEGGMADAQKISVGATVGFPLRNYGRSLQWTRKFFQNATVGELDIQVKAIFDAHNVAIDREIKRALFYSANVTFTDKLVDRVSLPVKRLVNADSAPIPLDPSGNSFNTATHTHYLGTNSLTASNLQALIETVVEHFGSGKAVVYINRASETAVRALTGFVAYQDVRLLQADNVLRAQAALDQNLLYNRSIGLFTSGGVSAEVWVKPWVPANYIFAYIQGAPKPLVMRERSAGSGDLQLVYEDERHPLRARSYEAEFGMGVWTRTNGAVLKTNNATYSDPTIS